MTDERTEGSGAGPDDAAVEWRVSDAPVPYPEALAAMEARVGAIRAGTAPEQVWLLEHPPLFTAGTSADPAELANPEGFPVFKAGRGGRFTYHGPGQRVAYVMLDLRARGADIRCYVHALEDWIITTLDRFNIRAVRRADRIGVWVADRRLPGGEGKIAARGVRVTRWVSWHGIAINLDPELTHFQGIVPCGIRGYGVTSLWAQGVCVSMAELDAALMACFDPVFSPEGSLAAAACAAQPATG
ncbi:MAG: lipoyl(octanoyl) transferase LipB [Alphaproteobacteria bacterium]|nr:lipoyl(octanoyl) transferase LipB [Alphaproteobacteria bacterium]